MLFCGVFPDGGGFGGVLGSVLVLPVFFLCFAGLFVSAGKCFLLFRVFLRLFRVWVLVLSFSALRPSVSCRGMFGLWMRSGFL